MDRLTAERARLHLVPCTSIADAMGEFGFAVEAAAEPDLARLSEFPAVYTTKHDGASAQE